MNIFNTNYVNRPSRVKSLTPGVCCCHFHQWMHLVHSAPFLQFYSPSKRLSISVLGIHTQMYTPGGHPTLAPESERRERERENMMLEMQKVLWQIRQLGQWWDTSTVRLVFLSFFFLEYPLYNDVQNVHSVNTQDRIFFTIGMLDYFEFSFWTFCGDGEMVSACTL